MDNIERTVIRYFKKHFVLFKWRTTQRHKYIQVGHHFFLVKIKCSGCQRWVWKWCLHRDEKEHSTNE